MGSETSTRRRTSTGSSARSPRSSSLRTTCWWTWLSAGTSTTRSPQTVAAHPRRLSPVSGRRPWYFSSVVPRPEMWLVVAVIPCLANSPKVGTTWQRPQIPRPPHTESKSTPSRRAVSSTVVPSGTDPRSPDGVKTTRCSTGSVMVGCQLGFGSRFRRIGDADCRGVLGRHRWLRGHGSGGSTWRSWCRRRSARLRPEWPPSPRDASGS